MSQLRIGGLASGMDIDALVEKLMQAERIPLDKLQQQKQIYEWTRDAYRNVNKKLQTFDTYIADNLLLKSFNTKTTTSSNSSLVEATATGSAAGTLTIEGVSQLASAARAVGGQVNGIGTTTLGDLFANSGVTVSQNYIEIRAIQKDGTLAAKATRIEFTENMTIDQFVSKINSSAAGVSAVFENGRLSITAKNTGDVKGGAEIVVDSGQEVFAAFQFADTTNLADNGKNAIFQVNGIATERASNSFSISGYNVTLKSTFNSVQTIAEKYIAAQKELELAGINLTNKTNQYNNAKDAYYGVGATETPSYTTAHNNAYKVAFGNTLTLSEQELFNKLGSAFWRKLSDDEINFILENKDDLKTAIEASDYTNLKALSDDKIQILADLSEQELVDYRLHANYQVYGTKLKDFDAAAIAAIQNFAYDSNDDLTTIHENIDNNPEFSDEVKKVLKSLSKDDLTNLLSTSPSTLEIYHQKAQADDLKTKYSALGDSFFNNLSASEIETISNIDFTQEDAISSITDETLRNKLEKLTENQIKALDSLTEEQLNNFKNLAEQNIIRSNYVKANSELNAAQTRLTNAQNTFDTAKEDAQNAGILNGDDIDEDALIGAPTTSPVSITSTTNVDDIISKIKDFVNTYNGLIKELNDLIKESKYRDYPPLTEAQRKEMDEKEIELWEEKAKSGLLRSDSIIREGISKMRALLYESNPAVSNPKYNTLFSIGITTSKNYNDGGTIEIDENKLRKALEEDPDAVAALFTNYGKKDDTIIENGVEKTVDTRGYLQKLREEMTNIKNKIEKKAGRTTMTANQYTLGKTLTDIESRIKTWKDKLITIEQRYWKQFTAMEQAINKANMQASLFMPQY